MKRFNKNVVITLVSFAIILIGLCANSFIAGMKESIYVFLFPSKNISMTERIDTFIDNIELYSSEYLSYSTVCVDINSKLDQIKNCRIVKKGEGYIVKLDNGYLADAYPKVDEKTMDSYADECLKIQQLTNEMNIPFVYVMAPEKGENAVFPAGVENHIKYNFENFLLKLKERDINVFDLRELKEAQGITDEDMFFVTDHHWKPQYGLWAANEIYKKLKIDYGFMYDEQLLNIDNYTVDTYENKFLGSQGKKVGQYFTELGPDDFYLVKPNFETDLVSEQPYVDLILEGNFSDTLLDVTNLGKKNVYRSKPYSTYIGDKPLQIVRNNLASEDAKKIVIIRDSFASVVAPFMAMVAKELHIIDLREFSGTRIPSATQYIKDVNPDAVMILYTNISDGENKRFDFR